MISQIVHVTALQKVNLNEKKRKSRTIVTYMYVKKWEDNMNSKIDRVKCIIRWQKTWSDDIQYTYNLEMILMRTWRKSWELEKWRSRSPLGGNDWNVRGPWWPILSACGGRAERDTWHHTPCPPVCKTAEKILYCNAWAQKYSTKVCTIDRVDRSARFQFPMIKLIFQSEASIWRGIMNIIDFSIHVYT